MTMQDDYISRQAAIGACFDGWNNSANDCARNIKSLSAADVVEVVRCKDCKHWDNGNLSFECPWDYGRYGSSDEDDFCSCGERKE